MEVGDTSPVACSAVLVESDRLISVGSAFLDNHVTFLATPLCLSRVRGELYSESIGDLLVLEFRENLSVSLSMIC